MSIILVDGGKKLNGSVHVHGAKNSVLPILAATIINKGVSVIDNCPNLKDVEASIEILRHLGCTVHRERDRVIVDSSVMDRCDIPDSLMREMRSSVIFLGATLARAGEAHMFPPGGCELGARPIDLHLAALRKLGAEIDATGGTICCKAGEMRGTAINLDFPSVGATENIMLTATCCSGTTTITNAAREPEIVDLQNFMVAMGAKVSGAGSSTIVIEGHPVLHDATHSVMADRIVAATYLVAAAVAGGNVHVRDINPEYVSTVTEILAEAGCMIREESGGITITRDKTLKSVKPIRTMPYPGFPTDAQAPVMAATLQAEGTTVFIESIFENRYRHVCEMLRMGADIKVEGRVAVVCGVPELHGAAVTATDLRGGAALVVAALGAQGQSSISGLDHIDRGYDGLEDALSSLGASIKRVEIG